MSFFTPQCPTINFYSGLDIWGVRGYNNRMKKLGILQILSFIACAILISCALYLNVIFMYLAFSSLIFAFGINAIATFKGGGGRRQVEK